MKVQEEAVPSPLWAEELPPRVPSPLSAEELAPAASPRCDVLSGHVIRPLPEGGKYGTVW